MFEKNDGKGVNAIQNKFTSMLKTALHNHRIDYAKDLLTFMRNSFSFHNTFPLIKKLSRL